MTRMGRYEIKNKSKGKSEEFYVVAREATHCMEDSGMMVMQGGTVATPNAVIAVNKAASHL